MKIEKRSAGPKERGAKVVGVQLEADEYKAVNVMAEEQGVTMSDVLRWALKESGVTDGRAASAAV